MTQKYTLFHSVLQPLIVHLSACLQRRNPIYKVYAVEQQKARKEKDDEMLRQAGIDEEKFRDLSSLLKRSQDAL